METKDVTIIGGGPVGLFAAFYAGMRGLSVRIVDSLPELGGQLTALYPEKYVFDMPGFPKVLAKDLAAGMAQQGRSFHPEVLLEETVRRLSANEDGYILTTASGQELGTRTLIIAAGAGAFTPTKVGVDREEHFEGRGLTYGVRDKASLEGKVVAIVGGGDSAFDWCLNLLGHAKSITLVHRRDVFRALEDSVEKVQASDVAMKLWSVITELHGEDRLEAVTVQNKQSGEAERLPLDALVVTIGFKSSLGPILDWGLELEKQQIKVSPITKETNLPGVFAVGDVCTYAGKLKLIATGVGEAVSAVCHAKQRLDPSAKLFPGHSSDMELGL